LIGTVCKIDGCAKPVVARGWCDAHYYRWKRNGDPLGGRLEKGLPRKWLEDHSKYESDECLEWPFCRNKRGYGQIYFDGFTLAHRWMCHAVNGDPTPKKPFALHSCGNGHLGCVNPKHLYWGSGVENYQDQIKHGVVARGERSGRARLNREIVRRIRKCAAQGNSKTEISDTLGIHRDAVRSVLRGRTWAWLK